MRSHDLLTRKNWQHADFSEVAEAAVAPLKQERGHRFSIAGPVVDCAQSLIRRGKNILIYFFERDAEDVYWNKSRDWGIYAFHSIAKQPQMLTSQGMQLVIGERTLFRVPDQRHAEGSSGRPSLRCRRTLSRVNGETARLSQKCIWLE